MTNQSLTTLIGDPAAIAIAACLGGESAWIVGGAVRDALLGVDPGPDLDVAVADDPGKLLACLGEKARRHERFGTASVVVGNRGVDFARTRSETYERPGALPEVEPAGIEADLGRRDFAVNAIAIALDDGRVIDPHGGREDLELGRLRMLHPDSIRDDPTRALRAARYAARLGFELEEATEAAIREADLSTVSIDRANAELALAAVEPSPGAVAGLLGAWGLFEVNRARVELVERAAKRVKYPAWSSRVEPASLLIPLLRGEPLAPEVETLAKADPQQRSEVYELGDRSRPGDLLLAGALGAIWVEEWLEIADTALSITGVDLLDAGLKPGPAVGVGLRAALRARLDGEVGPAASEQLDLALTAARAAGGESPA